MRLTDKEFIHLHCHVDKDSNLRFKDSIIKVPQLIEKAYEMGNKGVAFTGHESISSHISAMQYLEKQRKKGRLKDFKILYGNEIYLVDKEHTEECMSNNIKMDFFHFILIAKDEIGHSYLRELSTGAWRRGRVFRNSMRVPTYYEDLEEVVKEQGHLVATTACLGSYLGKTTTKSFDREMGKLTEEIDIDIQLDFIDYCKDIFGENDFYLELQPAISEEQIIYNKHLKYLSEISNTKCTIATDVHYLRPEHRKIHEAFITSDDNSGARETGEFYESTHMFYVKELYERMNYFEEKFINSCIRNTYNIMEECKEYTLEAITTIPLIPLPPEITWYQVPDKLFDKLVEMKEDFPNLRKLYNSEEECDRYWFSLIFKGLEEREIWTGELNLRLLEHLKRIEIEVGECLGISEKIKQPMSSYFVVMEFMVNELIWKKSQSILGASRGSSLGWVTNYLLNITQINPLDLPMDAPHWRFLCADRPDFPDIDIDVPAHKKDIVFYNVREYYRSIGGDMVKVGTFRTESAKSDVKSCCRGMGINNDIADYLSSLIPVERGQVWSIKETYYGDSTKGKLPVAEFRNIVDQHEGLLDALIMCENLISGMGIHASGVVPVNKPIWECNNSIQKAPNGEFVTCFDLHESEWAGVIKFDYLTTEATAIIQVCLELLVKYGKIEWQGDIRKTYEKYLMPKDLDYEDEEMWDLAIAGKILELFQMNTPQGKRVMSQIKPHNLFQLANVNSLMRLVSSKEEQPAEQYSRYKNNINEWYQEMEEYGLTEEEIGILREHLDKSYGMVAEQEPLMEMTMDKRISNFNIVEANKIRKGIAKKDKQALQEAKDLFYSKGLENGARKLFLDYIWEEKFSAQFGYSFSLLHTAGYSTIGVQEMNLATKYPYIYWACACLMIKSSSVDKEYNEGMDIENKESQSNTAKISSAIGQLQENNVEIANPNINTSEIGFTPDEEYNRIQVGFKPISGVNNAMAKVIMEARPFKSLQDFYERMTLFKVPTLTSKGTYQNKSLVPQSALISLIKSGAFDELEGKPREQIMDEFLHKVFPDKKSLDSKDIDKIQEEGLFPPEFDEYLKLYNYVEAVKECPKRQDPNVKSLKWAKLVDSDMEYQERLISFFEDNFMAEMTEGRDYQYDENGDLEVALCNRKSSLIEKYKLKTKPMQDYLKTEECKKAYNNYRFNQFKKYKVHVGNSISDWEFESVGYYSKQYGHSLAKVNLDDYMINNFGELPEEPEIEDWFKIKGNKYPKFKISRICGTVIDKNINKHFVTILTSDGKVINCKMQKGQIAFYNKQISMGEGKDKVVLEQSWFERGTKLLLHGYRMGQDFKCKTYNNSIYGKHVLKLIEEVYPDGTLKIKSERVNLDELD